MRPWVGSILLGAGLLVGAVGVAMLEWGIPVHLPAILVTIAVVKITFAGALGLLAAGAWLRRRALRAAARRPDAQALTAAPGAPGM
jgi:hypothetical protein